MADLRAQAREQAEQRVNACWSRVRQEARNISTANAFHHLLMAVLDYAEVFLEAAATPPPPAPPQEPQKQEPNDREDAERFRWLEAQIGLHLYSDYTPWTRPDGAVYRSSHRLCAGGMSFAAYPTLRETIDMAMSTQQKKAGEA